MDFKSWVHFCAGGVWGTFELSPWGGSAGLELTIWLGCIVGSRKPSHEHGWDQLVGKQNEMGKGPWNKSWGMPVFHETRRGGQRGRRKPRECDIKIWIMTREKLLKKKGVTEKSSKIRLKTQNETMKILSDLGGQKWPSVADGASGKGLLWGRKVMKEDSTKYRQFFWIAWLPRGLGSGWAEDRGQKIIAHHWKLIGRSQLK